MNYDHGAPSRSATPVVQLRLVIEVDDFDDALAFYRDQLGLPEEFLVDSGNDARVVALQAGRATLELVTSAQRRLIDHLEVGHDVSPPIRVAFEVTDVDTATTHEIAAGAEQVSSPTGTPWRSATHDSTDPDRSISHCSKNSTERRRGACLDPVASPVGAEYSVVML